MSYILIRFALPPAVTSVDLLISSIERQIPATQVTAEDWFAKRRIEEEAVITKLRAAGNPLPRAQEILDSTERASPGRGRVKEILIPMRQSGVLVGRISCDTLLLHSNTPIDSNVADDLLRALKSIGGDVSEFRVSDRGGEDELR